LFNLKTFGATFWKYRGEFPLGYVAAFGRAYRNVCWNISLTNIQYNVSWRLYFLIWAFELEQRGPTTSDLRAILQNCDYMRTSSNKMMCKTTDSQQLKLKKGRQVSWSLKQYQNINLLQIFYQWDACGRDFSDTIVQCFASHSIYVFRFALSYFSS